MPVDAMAAQEMECEVIVTAGAAGCTGGIDSEQEGIDSAANIACKFTLHIQLQAD
jgi:hypothetical protein